MSSGPTRDFWREKFQARDTPWDRGEVHPQLRRWIDEGALKPCRILVPGCGSGHEVAYLAAHGFDVTAIDYATEAVQLARERVAAAGLKAKVEEADALTWNSSHALDVVYEQTCLCALHPDHWVAYAAQVRKWLRPGGTMFALFMQARCNLLREAMEPIQFSGLVPALARYLEADPVTAFLAGAALAFVLHSSLAAILMCVALVAVGALPVLAGVALTLGANLGGALIPVRLGRGLPPSAGASPSRCWRCAASARSRRSGSSPCPRFSPGSRPGAKARR